jgi:hypothetical protein
VPTSDLPTGNGTGDHSSDDEDDEERENKRLKKKGDENEKSKTATKGKGKAKAGKDGEKPKPVKKKGKGGIQIPDEWLWEDAKRIFEKPDVTPADEVEVCPFFFFPFCVFVFSSFSVVPLLFAFHPVCVSSSKRSAFISLFFTFPFWLFPLLIGRI